MASDRRVQSWHRVQSMALFVVLAALYSTHAWPSIGATGLLSRLGELLLRTAGTGIHTERA